MGSNLCYAWFTLKHTKGYTSTLPVRQLSVCNCCWTKVPALSQKFSSLCDGQDFPSVYSIKKEMRAWNSLFVHLLNWLCLAGALTIIIGQALHYRIKLQRTMDCLYCTETVIATCDSILPWLDSAANSTILLTLPHSLLVLCSLMCKAN